MDKFSLFPLVYHRTGGTHCDLYTHYWHDLGHLVGVLRQLL